MVRERKTSTATTEVEGQRRKDGNRWDKEEEEEGRRDSEGDASAR